MQFDEVYQYTKDLKILYVEDDKNLLKETLIIFENYFNDIDTAINGIEALELYKNSKYDLVITDINMPIMDGATLIKEIHNINLQQDVIIISAYSDSERLIDLIQLNISSFILKPICLEKLSLILHQTCKNIFAKKRMELYHNEIDNLNQTLNKKVKDLSQEILFVQQISLEAIADMVESYDNETGSHTKRIEQFTKLIINHLPENKDCPSHLKEFVPFASLLHDIGKMFIPKEILIKPSKLTQSEFMIIKTHSQLGGEMLNNANEVFKKRFKKDSFLKVASNIAYYHHEKWDGSGYPKGLKGEDIPMCARVVAVVDVYDALRSKRVYKEAFSHQEAVEIIKNSSKTHFDPMVVDIFLKLEKEFDDTFKNSNIQIKTIS